MIFTPKSNPSNKTTYRVCDYEGPGVAMGMYNIDEVFKNNSSRLKDLHTLVFKWQFQKHNLFI